MKKNDNYYGSCKPNGNWHKLLLKMKITTFLLFCGLMNLLAGPSYSQSTKISLNMKEASVESVLNKIEDESEFFFLFNHKLIDVERKVNVDAKGVPIKDILSDIFPDDVQIIVSDRQIVLTTVQKSSELEGLIQSQVVTGRVTDAVTGEPLLGVYVVIEGTNTGVITDLQGNYSFELPSKDIVLVFSYIGYKSEKIAVEGKSIIDVALVPDIKSLEEVVVIGYGTRSKRDVTTAISTLSSDKIEKVVATSPELLMQGLMSGVQIIGNQGDPNARPTVRIRGTNTWGISDPLYVIDGIPIKEYGAGIEGAADQYVRGYMNIMAMIDPNDIESISVLKDASAGAIYGVRAANGVVLITTKKGKKGTPTINYSQRIGIQNVYKNLDVLNTKQYADFNNALYASDPASIDSRDGLNYVFNPADPGYLGNSPTSDWQSAVKNKNSLQQDYSFNVSGGTDRADYYLSFGYADKEGVNIENRMKRYSGSFKLNVNATDYLRLGINYRLSSQSTNNSFSKSPISVAQMPPWQPVYDPDGINGYAAAINGYDENGIWTGDRKYGSNTGRNDLGYLSLTDHTLSALRNMGNAYVELEPLKGFKLRGTINVDKFDNSGRGGTQYVASYFQIDGGNPTARGGASSLADYERRIIDNLNIITEFTASYTKSIGKHNIDVLFNSMYQNYSVDILNAYTVYVPTSDPNIANLGGDNQYTSIVGEKNKGALVGYLLRADYNYASKYYLDLVVRRDGSSRFAPENRWGTFPAVSASWRLSSEGFMENIEWIDDLKLRAGWGKLGNQEVKEMAYLSPIDDRPTFTWGNNPGNIGRGYPSSSGTVYGMPNSDLTWEKTSTLNIGFDAVMFKGLEASFEYYYKLTEGILQTLTLPPSAGLIEKPTGNVAKVQNEGVELNLNYSNNIGQFNFSVGGNLTTVRNRVVTLYGGIPMGTIEEGYPLFYIKGYQIDGMFQTDGEVAEWLANHEDLSYQAPNIRPGDFYFKDLRGAPGPDDKFYSTTPDGIVDSYDEVYLGKTIPGFFYGFNFNLGYKNFDFTMSFTGVGDVQKVNEVKSSLLNLNNEAAQHTPEALNYWTPTNTNTNIPRLIWGDPASNGRFSNYWVEDAGYLRLANTQLGYTLPDIGIKNILDNLRFYLGCSNLFTITNFKGFDPEDENNPAPVIMYCGLTARF